MSSTSTHRVGGVLTVMLMFLRYESRELPVSTQRCLLKVGRKDLGVFSQVSGESFRFPPAYLLDCFEGNPSQKVLQCRANPDAVTCARRKPCSKGCTVDPIEEFRSSEGCEFAVWHSMRKEMVICARIVVV